jgi:hypothetical protein
MALTPKLATQRQGHCLALALLRENGTDFPERLGWIAMLTIKGQAPQVSEDEIWVSLGGNLKGLGLIQAKAAEAILGALGREFLRAVSD